MRSSPHTSITSTWQAGFLPQTSLHRRADRPLDRILDRFGIAALGCATGRRAVSRPRLAMRSAMSSPCAVLRRQAHDVDDRVADELALLVDGDRDRDDAGEGELATLRHRPVAGTRDDVAVLVEATGRHVVDDLRPCRARGAPSCRCWRSRPRATPCARAKRACSARCRASPWAGIAMLRPGPAIHLRPVSSAARMAGDVDEFGAVGDDLDALRRSRR